MLCSVEFLLGELRNSEEKQRQTQSPRAMFWSHFLSRDSLRSSHNDKPEIKTFLLVFPSNTPALPVFL